MVRQKSRWLLIRIDLEDQVKSIKDTSTASLLEGAAVKKKKEDPAASSSRIQLEKKNIFHALRIMIEESFGIARSGIIDDIQVRLYSSEARLAIVKVPRDDCDLVRSAVTFLTQIQEEPVTAVVLATNGSARTAKVAAMRQVRKDFREKYRDARNIGIGKKELQKLDSLIDHIRGID